jgi:acetate kinase
MNILALNAGSNSLKFEVVAAEPDAGPSDAPSYFGASLASGAYDDIGKNRSAFSLLCRKRVLHKEEIEVRDHGHATELLFDWIERGGAREHGIQSLADIEGIGHRVVHGADIFDGPAPLTDEVIQQIGKTSRLYTTRRRSK